MAFLGHPLVGDPAYGGRRQLTADKEPAVRTALVGFKRQALHATRLAFEHPMTGEAVDVEAPPPTDFKRLLKVLRTAAGDT